MRLPGDRLDGFSLPTVLVICVLMALILLSALAFASLDRQNYAVYHRQKQWILDLHSVAAKYRVDSTLVRPGDSLTVTLSGTPDSDVSVSLSRWGFYEVASFRSEHLPFTHTQIVGKAFPSKFESVLYVADRNRPLSLAGTTRVEGVIHAPQGGINYTELMGRPFTGPEIPTEDWRVSTDRLPPLDSTVFAYLDSLAGLRPQAWYHLNVPDARNSFLARTNLSYSRNPDETFNMRGNRILYADKLWIGKNSTLDGILAFAKTATIEDGFEGCLQLFCTDSIVVGRDVRLRYPSGLYAANEEEHPCITMRQGSWVDGYVMALTGGREDMMLEHPCLRQEEGAVVEGLLYVDGTACVRGSVNGAAYLRDCFYDESGEKYPGVLYDCTFSQAEDMVYPVVIDGPYRRRAIKKVY